MIVLPTKPGAPCRIGPSDERIVAAAPALVESCCKATWENRQTKPRRRGLPIIAPGRLPYLFIHFGETNALFPAALVSATFRWPWCDDVRRQGPARL